jgi:hypothetical protein
MRESVRPASVKQILQGPEMCGHGFSGAGPPTKRKLETVFGYYLFGFLVDQE